ncbi:MAG: aminotransferase class I/II-fold pyridoxal phosphate-dependent enzyme, partial [Planctomycetota bacterium]
MEEARNAILNAELEAIRASGLERSTDRPTRGIDFTSNDYLGLSRHPAVVEAGLEALRRSGAGAGAARLLAGPLETHAAVEARVAEWVDSEAALLFPSGFQANHGVLGVLAGPGDTIHSDRLVHASLIDAARASRATVWVHDHLDLDHLERDLRLARRARRRIVVTEGIFSMDGDAAPIEAMCELCLRHDAWLVVDEAHTVGLVGPHGAGLVAAAAAAGAPTEAVAARVVTGGKALGVGGALVTGSRPLRELLVNRARSFVFTTASPPALAASLQAAVDIAAEDGERRERCLRLSRSIALGLGLREPAGAIVPAIVPGNAAVTATAARLEQAGFGVRAVRSPTVPVGAERLRLVAHSFNTEEQVDRLVEAVRSDGIAVAAKLGGPP